MFVVGSETSQSESPEVVIPDHSRWRMTFSGLVAMTNHASLQGLNKNKRIALAVKNDNSISALISEEIVRGFAKGERNYR